MFNVKDKVFAKIQGYPAWPAIISGVDTNSPSEQKYNVYFYGTGKRAECKPEELFSYEENKSNLGKPNEYKYFAEALFEIEKDVEGIVLSKNDTQEFVTPSYTSTIEHNLQPTNDMNKAHESEKIKESNSKTKEKLTIDKSNVSEKENLSSSKKNSGYSTSKKTQKKMSGINPEKSSKKSMTNKMQVPAKENSKSSETQNNGMNKSDTSLKQNFKTKGSNSRSQNLKTSGNHEVVSVSQIGNKTNGFDVNYKETSVDYDLADNLKVVLASILSSMYVDWDTINNNRFDKMFNYYTEAIMLSCIQKLRVALCIGRAELDKGLQLLKEMSELELTDIMLKKHIVVVGLIKKLTEYNENLSEQDLNEKETIERTEKIIQIRQMAEIVNTKLISLFTVPDGQTFQEVFLKEVRDFFLKTENLSRGDVLGITLGDKF